MSTHNPTHTGSDNARDSQPPALIAYHVSERGTKKFWTRIGAAWNHEDGKGLTVQLELMPVVVGRIVLREPNRGDDREDTGA